MLASGSKEACWDALELDCVSKVARHRHYGRRSSVLSAVGIGTIAQAHGHIKVPRNLWGIASEWEQAGVLGST